MKYTTCVDCDIKIPNTRMRCEECWTIGLAEDLGLDVDDMLSMAKTKKGIEEIANLFINAVNAEMSK